MKNSVQIILSSITFIAVLFLGTVTHAQTISDKALKKNTAPVTNSVSYITQLQPVSYEFNQKDFKQLDLPSGTQFGFIAEDVKQIMPWAVSSQNNWFTAGKNSQRSVATPKVDLEKLVPVLVGAVKEQQAQIEALKLEVQRLKAK